MGGSLMTGGIADVGVVVALVGVVLLGALVVAQGRALRRHRQRYRAAFAGTDATALLDALREQADELDDLRAALDAIANATRAEDHHATGAQDSSGRVSSEQRRPAVDRMAVVRYDAFPSAHGQGPSLSFSLALLDDRLDGVVLTAITGRNESRVYCKAVQDGHGERELSDEERAAIDAAASGEHLVLADTAGSPPDDAGRTLPRRTA